MRQEPVNGTDRRVEAALAELQRLIEKRYPDATFVVFHGEDPEGLYLRATVDVEDTDEVMDAVVDRLHELQVEEELPVYVLPVRTPEREAALLEQVSKQKRSAAPIPPSTHSHSAG